MGKKKRQMFRSKFAEHPRHLSNQTNNTDTNTAAPTPVEAKEPTPKPVEVKQPPPTPVEIRKPTPQPEPIKNPAVMATPNTEKKKSTIKTTAKETLKPNKKKKK